MRNAVRFFVFGILLLLNGLIFFLMDKTDPVYSFYSGPACMIVGLILWMALRKKQQY